MKKLIVYLRHNNDIDHITPVLYKWLMTKDIPVQVYLMDKKYLKDRRMNFLTEHFKNINISVFKKMNDDTGVVVFDWVINDTVEKLIKEYNKKNMHVVSLPHGDSPYINRLDRIRTLCYDDVRTNDKFNLYDFVVVPNWLCERRYKGVMDTGKIKVLGSARYCNEWLGVHDTHIPMMYYDRPNGNRLLLMYTRNIEYPINWAEAARVIKMILEYKDITLVVKRHSRSTGGRIVEHRIKSYLPMAYTRNKNLVFTTTDYPITDAHMILDMGTSMSWDAVKKQIPVLCLDLLHCNRSTIGYYINNCLVDTRDRLVDNLNKFVEGIEFKYDEMQRKSFIKEIIDVPDKNVLEHYVDFLEELF